MIGQPKPFASLSSTLLARKGTARPAMRPQGFGGFGALQTQDDLGWNDMGDPHDVHAHHEEQPAVPPVLMQREALQREMIGDDFDAPPVQPAPMFDSYEDEPEPELEEDYAPAIESVLAVKPVRAVETPVAALAVASSPVVAPPVAAPPVVVAPVAAVPVAAPSVANMVPVAVTLPPARAAQIVRETSAKRGKAAFTLRLDQDRHLHLRLASALRNRSAQQLVTEALDAFLETLPEVAELANQLSPPAAR
ncbi:hypothetical protein [Sphingomonas alpina]|uniref:hypothetical protein n=1 Tax=Sphingomonas alpina TaxID=653931 RepID=UPI0036F25F96